MHHWTGSSLLQLLACCPFGAGSLPKQILTYCQCGSGEQTSVISKIQTFSVKMSSAKWQPFCCGLSELMHCSFHLQGSDGHMYQVWFDNVKSLKIKYDLAVNMGLRGVGMWAADSIDYTNTTVGEQQRKEMWGALPDYKKGRHGIYGGSVVGKLLTGSV